MSSRLTYPERMYLVIRKNVDEDKLILFSTYEKAENFCRYYGYDDYDIVGVPVDTSYLDIRTGKIVYVLRT